MVKHTQTICRLLGTNCLSVFDHFVGLAFKGLRKVFAVMGQNILLEKWNYHGNRDIPNRRFHFCLTTQGKYNRNPVAVRVMNNVISKLIHLGK